jgi:hypothetical protein
MDGKVSGAKVVSKTTTTMYTHAIWKQLGINDPNAVLQSMYRLGSRRTIAGLEASAMWNAVKRETEGAQKASAAAATSGGPTW